MHPDLVRNTLLGYVNDYPTSPESAELTALLNIQARGWDITARSLIIPGHVVASAIVVRPDQRVLMVHHRGLDRFVPPGGHVDPGDASLYQTALRELEEETGIRPDEVEPLGPPVPDPRRARPFFFRVHEIPESAFMREGVHLHAAAHYAFRTRLTEVRELQDVEVSGAAWQTLDELRHPAMRDRLRVLLNSEGAQQT